MIKKSILVIVVHILKWALAVRYKIKIKGLAKLHGHGLLFLSNFPSFIDPVILWVYLVLDFNPTILVDRKGLSPYFYRLLKFSVQFLFLPDLKDKNYRETIGEILDDIVDLLKDGQNILLFPAGKRYQKKEEDLSANSGVYKIIQQFPDVQIVLIRTKGTWGSFFSEGYYDQNSDSRFRFFLMRIFDFLASGLFFVPKRNIEIEFVIPSDLPVSGDKQCLKKYLEKFFNKDFRDNTFIAYNFWKGKSPRIIPDPKIKQFSGNTKYISNDIKEIVFNFIKELSGLQDIREEDNLGSDLGIDSLSKIEIAQFINKEFGLKQEDPSVFETVQDVLLAAYGEKFGYSEAQINKVTDSWYDLEERDRLAVLSEGKILTKIFLKKARAYPRRVIINDQKFGTRSYREMISDLFILKNKIETIFLGRDKVAIMLNSSGITLEVFWAVLFSGKAPLMINWSGGGKHIIDVINKFDIKEMITSRKLIKNLEGNNYNFRGLFQKFHYIEDLIKDISLQEKIKCHLKSIWSWKELELKKSGEDLAVILFTSGTEGHPRAVPLTHKNIITNLKDMLEMIPLSESDRILGLLPPFHSFGLVVNGLLPMCLGIPVAYAHNPNDSIMISKMIREYGLSVIVSIPTFLEGLLKYSHKNSLKTIRLIISGGEKLSEKTHEYVKSHFSWINLLEGYGTTECSPVISVNPYDRPKKGTVGTFLSHLEYKLIDTNEQIITERNQIGELILRGDSVFSGYLEESENEKTFTLKENNRWYRTGDLVQVNEENYLTFCGRIKRFVKVSGEMVSLTLIETLLENYFRGKFSYNDNQIRILTVESLFERERTEMALFIVFKNISIHEVNQVLRDKGLGAVYNVHRVIWVDQLCLLENGKVDHEKMQKFLQQ